MNTIAQLAQTEDLRNSLTFTQLASKDTVEAHLTQAALMLLRGRIYKAQEAIEQAGSCSDTPQYESLIDAFRNLLLFEQFDRYPDEKKPYSAEIFLTKKQVAAYPNRYPKHLIGEGVLIEFFNTRLRFLEIRTLRSLLQGVRFMQNTDNLNVLYQNEVQSNQNRFVSGDLFAGLIIADLVGQAGEETVQTEQLRTVMQAATQAKDTHSIGLCWLQLMDAQVSKNSSPLVWDFTLETSSAQGSVLPASTEKMELQPLAIGAIQRARKGYNTALTLFKNEQAERGIGAVFLRFSYLYFLENEIEKALDLAQQAAQVFQFAKDFLYQKLAETYQICCFILLGEPTKALVLSQKMAKRGLESGAKSWYLGLGVFLGRFARHLALRLGQTEQSLFAYKLAHAFQTTLGNDYHAAQHLTDIADLYKSMGMTEAAIAHYEQAVDAMEFILTEKWAKVEDESGTLLHTRLNMAMLLSDNFILGQNRRDGYLMERSVERMGDIMAQVLAQASPEQMVSMPQIQQIAALHTAQQEVALVSAPLYRAKTLREAGKMVEFEVYWQKAKDGLELTASGQRYYLEMAVYGLKHDWESAKKALENYLAAGASNQGLIGDLMQAMAAFGTQGQAEISQQNYRDVSLAFISYVRIQAYTKAKENYDALCAHYGENWYEREQNSYLNIGDIAEMYEGLGDFEQAMAYYDLALATLEAYRKSLSQDEQKVAFADSQNIGYLYTYAARTALNLGQKEKAFMLAEAGKARGLLDLMAENTYFAKENTKLGGILRAFRALDARRSILTNSLVQAQKTNPLEVGFLQNQIKDIEQQRLEVETEIRAQRYDFFGKLERLDTLPDFDFIKNQLEADTLLLEYQLLGDDLLMWAMSSNGIEATQALKIEDWKIVSLVSQLNEAIKNKGAWADFAKKLGIFLLQPFEALFTDFKQLIIVPHGGLHRLPFQVLPWKNLPLGFQKALRYAPSAAALQFLNGGKSLSIQKALAIGNPTGDLPASGEEALFVGATFGPMSRVYIGNEATEAAVRASISKADLVHFATHGTISESAPMRSAIQLAQGENLNLSELMGLEIKAELVALSACETGKGNRTGGDEVLSLTRGLIAAGAKAAMVSLWQVDDRSTALFMQHFYKKIKAGTPPAEALRQTQIHLSELPQSAVQEAFISFEQKLNPEKRQQFSTNRGSFDENADSGHVGFSHPFYWAGFVLVG